MHSKAGPSEGLKIRGCQYYLVGIICPPWLRYVGLTDLLKSGGAMAPSAQSQGRQACKVEYYLAIFVNFVIF